MTTAVQPIKTYRPKITDLKLKIIGYGPPGVGKTTFAVSAAQHELTSPCLFINIESGLMSVVDKLDNIDVVDYENLAQLQNVLWYLIKEKHPYKTVIMDSVSELQVSNIEAIVKAQVAAKTNAKRVSEDDIWQDDYGTSTQQMRRVLRAFRDLPMHVILTCHDAATTSDGRTTSVHPALTPKLRQSAIGYFDIVGYMFTKEVNNELSRRMLVQPAGIFTAKDRSPGGALGNYIEEPSIPKIMDILTGKTKTSGK